MASKVTVAGVAYPVVESLGFNHDVGQRAWVVRMPDGAEKMVVGTKASARFWGAADRVAPLRQGVREAQPLKEQE